MTVAEQGEHIGRLAEVIDERDLDTDQPKVTLKVREGRINPDLSIGIDLTSLSELTASAGLSTPGVKLHVMDLS